MWNVSAPVPEISHNISGLQALFDASPDAIMVEHFDPPLPYPGEENNDIKKAAATANAPEYEGSSSISYANRPFLELLKQAGFVEDTPLTRENIRTLVSDVMGDKFAQRWRGRTQHIIDNVQLSQYYLENDDDRPALMLSTTPIIENGLLTGCWTRVTDATDAIIQQAEDQRALKQIEGFVRTENAAIVCLHFATALPTRVSGEQLGAAYYDATVTHITDPAVELFCTTPEALLHNTVKGLENPVVNRFIDSGLPQSSAGETMNLGDAASLPVVIDINTGTPQTYRVNPCTRSKHGG